MATASARHEKLYHIWLGNRPRPTLNAKFSEQDLEVLFEEDLSAGRTVPFLLASVIFTGMLLAIASVALLAL